MSKVLWIVDKLKGTKQTDTKSKNNNNNNNNNNNTNQDIKLLDDKNSISYKN